METRRCESRAGLVCAASTASRLADVVCRPGFGARERLVYATCAAFTGRKARSYWVAGSQSISRSAAPLHQGNLLSLPVRDDRGTSEDRRLVDAERVRRISSDGLTSTITSG